MITPTCILPLLLGWLLDLLLGDPRWLPHPIVGFGKMIACGERLLNRGFHRKWRGAMLALVLVGSVFAVTWALLYVIGLGVPFPMGGGVVSTVLIFFCLAGTTLVREVRQTFRAVDRSLDEGRKQVARIVGRDTAQLSAQEIRTAALFWLCIGGVPGMLAYKMVNTLDSMIGYKTERYKDFGCFAARMDDVANYVPARLTALLMVLASGRLRLLKFVVKYGSRHASPNSGYPEAALASILHCRFGGPHTYFGQLFDKPYIGENERLLTTADMQTAVRISRAAECFAVLLVVVITFIFNF